MNMLTYLEANNSYRHRLDPLRIRDSLLRDTRRESAQMTSGSLVCRVCAMNFVHVSVRRWNLGSASLKAYPGQKSGTGT